jgi:hypothetical protein
MKVLKAKPAAHASNYRRSKNTGRGRMSSKRSQRIGAACTVPLGSRFLHLMSQVLKPSF